MRMTCRFLTQVQMSDVSSILCLVVNNVLTNTTIGHCSVYAL